MKVGFKTARKRTQPHVETNLLFFRVFHPAIYVR